MPRKIRAAVPTKQIPGVLTHPKLAPCVEALDLRQATFLAAALLDPQSLTQIRYAQVRSRLAPHWGLATQMLIELSECGAIVLEPLADSHPAWAPQAKISFPAWRLSEAFAALKELSGQVIGHARARAGDQDASDELFTLWRELAISESAGFLGAELADHRFDEDWALTAVPALERGLRRLSVNQMSYFCWLSVREAASRYLRFPGSVSSLADGLVAYIDQRVDRALSERWVIRDWSGARRVVSSVAQVFSEQVTDLGADYLGKVPSRVRFTNAPSTDARSSVPGTGLGGESGSGTVGSVR